MSTIVAAETSSLDDLKKVPFTRYDLGWVIMCIGMAIGAGIVFLPVQVGIKGLWVFLASAVLAWPALHILQNLYLKTLSQTEDCSDYTSVITQYLGKNWSFFLSVAYFIMLLKGMLTYSLAITFDSASYIQTFGFTEVLLSDYVWYGLVVLCIMTAIAAQGERVIFKVAGPMVIFKLAIVVLLGVVMLPFWSAANIPSLPSASELLVFLRDVVLTLPFTLFAIMFVQILSPMNVGFRKVEPDPRRATYRAIRANRIAYAILVVSVLFMTLSFSFSITHEQAVEAGRMNISALAIAAQVIPGPAVATLTTLLNIFAIMSAFFGIFLGFSEAIKGIAVNVITRFIPRERINNRLLTWGVCTFIVALLWLWVTTRFPILLLQQLGAPIYGVVSCLIPCYLVYKVPVLHKFKTPSVLLVVLIGVLLCLSPTFKLLE